MYVCIIYKAKITGIIFRLLVSFSYMTYQNICICMCVSARKWKTAQKGVCCCTRLTLMTTFLLSFFLSSSFSYFLSCFFAYIFLLLGFTTRKRRQTDRERKYLSFFFRRRPVAASSAAAAAAAVWCLRRSPAPTARRRRPPTGTSNGTFRGPKRPHRAGSAAGSRPYPLSPRPETRSSSWTCPTERPRPRPPLTTGTRRRMTKTSRTPMRTWRRSPRTTTRPLCWARWPATRGRSCAGRRRPCSRTDTTAPRKPPGWSWKSCWRRNPRTRLTGISWSAASWARDRRDPSWSCPRYKTSQNRRCRDRRRCRRWPDTW